MAKIEEALYLEYDRKAKKWKLIGMYSEKCYGEYGSKKEANEKFGMVMNNDKIISKRKV
jgi:hypothetical protein